MMKLVYMGVDYNSIFNKVTEDMMTYNLIPGKEYDIKEELDRMWIVDAYLPDMFGLHRTSRIIDKGLVNLFFKPLTEIRDNKLNEILKCT